jgi:hypothetical protein
VVTIAGHIDLAGDIDVDGTLEADAITIGSTAIGSIYGVIAGSSSIVTTGALDSGSITSGFGTIDTGSSAITTTGVITGGTVEATTDTAAGDNAAMGYASADGLVLTGQGSTNDVTIKNDADGTVLEIATGTTNVELTSGNLIIGTSGQGIDFSATAGTGTSELLDDYEEGTWTPVLGAHSANGTHSYTTQVGTYTKVGNVVNVWFNLTINTLNTSGTISGNLKVMGLPFTSNSTAGLYNIGTFVPVGLDFDGGVGPVTIMGVSIDYIELIASVDNASYDTFTSEDVASGDAFWSHNTYTV